MPRAFSPSKANSFFRVFRETTHARQRPKSTLATLRRRTSKFSSSFFGLKPRTSFSSLSLFALTHAKIKEEWRGKKHLQTESSEEPLFSECFALDPGYLDLFCTGERKTEKREKLGEEK